MMHQPNHCKEVINTINQRVSVRAYTTQVLDKGTVQSLIAAGVRAPTAMHQEPWSFVVVQNLTVLKRISDHAKPLFLQRIHHADSAIPALSNKFTESDFNIFYNASTLIVIYSKPTLPFVEADCWLAAANMMLAASAMDLGSCVIGSALDALNTQEIRTELAIPAELTAIAALIVGRPEGLPAPTSRHAPRILSWRI